METTFAHLRMNAYADILSLKERLGEEAFKEIRNRIYRDLLLLGVGKFYPLDVTWTEIDMETKVRLCCLFISEDKGGGYEMSLDYKKIIHKHKNEEKNENLHKLAYNWYANKIRQTKSGKIQEKTDRHGI